MKNQPLNVFIAHGDDDARDVIEATLKGLNFEVLLSTAEGHRLISRCETDPPDVVFIGTNLADADCFDICNELCQLGLCPAVALVPESEVERAKSQMLDHVAGILVEPATANQLRSSTFVARRRYQDARRLRARISDLRTAIYADSESEDHE